MQRHRWGAILNRCRDTARLTSAMVADEKLCGQIIDWTAAYGIAVRQYLRGEKCGEQYRGLIEEQHIEKLMQASHVPLAILEGITDMVRHDSFCLLL